MLRVILYIISKSTINYIIHFFVRCLNFTLHISFFNKSKLLLHIKYNAQIGKHSQKWGKEN